MVLSEARQLAHRLVELGGPLLPRRLVAETLTSSLSDLGLALCLHRVTAGAPPYTLLGSLNIDPGELDRFLALFRLGRAEGRNVRLTVTFDDGYADAAAYVASRAPLYPEVDWIFFVCPQKTRDQVGFRWDAYEGLTRGPLRREDLLTAIDADLDRAREHGREDLRRVVGNSRYALATVEQVRALGRLPNVTLGNHTNHHFRLTRLSPQDALDELARSVDDFEALFDQRCTHTAFPYGVPGRDYREAEVDWLRTRGIVPWSTEGRPYLPQELTGERAVPRFGVGFQMDHRVLALRLAASTMRYRRQTDRVQRLPRGRTAVAAPDSPRSSVG